MPTPDPHKLIAGIVADAADEWIETRRFAPAPSAPLGNYDALSGSRQRPPQRALPAAQAASARRAIRDARPTGTSRCPMAQAAPPASPCRTRPLKRSPRPWAAMRRSTCWPARWPSGTSPPQACCGRRMRPSACGNLQRALPSRHASRTLCRRLVGLGPCVELDRSRFRCMPE